MFQRPSGHGWTGGDGAYSVSLPAGRTLWLFGDSVLGTVREGRRDSSSTASETPSPFSRIRLKAAIHRAAVDPLRLGRAVFERLATALRRHAAERRHSGSLVRARASGKTRWRGRSTASWWARSAAVQRDRDGRRLRELRHVQLRAAWLDAERDRGRRSPVRRLGVSFGRRLAERQLVRSRRLVEPGRTVTAALDLLWGTYVIADPDDRTHCSSTVIAVRARLKSSSSRE